MDWKSKNIFKWKNIYQYFPRNIRTFVLCILIKNKNKFGCSIFVDNFILRKIITEILTERKASYHSDTIEREFYSLEEEQIHKVQKVPLYNVVDFEEIRNLIDEEEENKYYPIYPFDKHSDLYPQQVDKDKKRKFEFI